VRIDRSDPADGSGDAPIARRAQSTPDDADAPGNDRDTAVTGDGGPDAYPARPDSALLKELTAAHRADVDAVYRQYAIDHGHARVEKLDQETTIPGPRIDAGTPEPHPVGLDDRLKGNGQLASAADLKKDETRQAPADHQGRIRDRTIPGDRGDEYDVVPRTPALVRDYDLPEGYKSAPALKGDPYHPDSVAARSTANQELYAATSRDRAATLGYTTRISAQKAPFDSHGQEVFTNGKTYITPDIDGHNVTNGWKMFNRRGVRIGTYDSELNYVKE
jgi:Novel toxin 21